MTLSVGSSGSDQLRTSQEWKPEPNIDEPGGSGPLPSFPSESEGRGRSEDPTAPTSVDLWGSHRPAPTHFESEGVAPPNKPNRETRTATLVQPTANQLIQGAPIVGLGLAATPFCDQPIRAQPILLVPRYREAG